MADRGETLAELVEIGRRPDVDRRQIRSSGA
jgi:hypothetical protein